MSKAARLLRRSCAEMSLPNDLIRGATVRSDPHSQDRNDSIGRYTMVDLVGRDVRVVSDTGSVCDGRNESSVREGRLRSSFDRCTLDNIISSGIVADRDEVGN